MFLRLRVVSGERGETSRHAPGRASTVQNSKTHPWSSFLVAAFGVLRTSISICFNRSPACPTRASTCVNCVRFFTGDSGDNKRNAVSERRMEPSVCVQGRPKNREQ